MTRFNFNRIALLQLLTLLLLLMPVLGGGLAVWYQHQQLQSSLADLEPRFARLLGLVNHRADLQALRNQANAALTRLAYPASQDNAKAGNDAQQAIRTAFASSQLEVISIQVLPAKDEGPFNRIAINLRVEGDLAAMQAALEKLSGQTPAVLVEGVTLQTIGAARPASIQRLGGQFSLSVFQVRS